MTIEQIDVVDFISNDKEGNVFLSISDHLEWDEEMEHLNILQEKINKYLSFIESGEINEHCEDINEKNIIINLICKYKPNNVAHDFFTKTKAIIEDAGFYFEWNEYDENKSNS